MSSNLHSTVSDTVLGRSLVRALLVPDVDLGDHAGLGQRLLSALRQQGLRVVHDDASLRDDDPTDVLPVLDLPLAVRTRMALESDLTLELEQPEEEGCVFLRRQAE